MKHSHTRKADDYSLLQERSLVRNNGIAYYMEYMYFL